MRFLIYIQGILLIVLFGLVIFVLIPAQYNLHMIRNKIDTNNELELRCKIAALDYDCWWEAPQCDEYMEYHKEYEQWLINN